MTPAEFRRLALGLPDAVEGSHMGHSDFRVGGKIFATLGYPSAEWGMVKLTPRQQDELVRAFPATIAPAKGAWGARGITSVKLLPAKRDIVLEALRTAWGNTAKRATRTRPDKR